jgi:hypothetical protein
MEAERFVPALAGEVAQHRPVCNEKPVCNGNGVHGVLHRECEEEEPGVPGTADGKRVAFRPI